MDHGKTFGAADGSLVDYDGICQKVRAAADPVRLRAVSLHDERGEVLWLTESSMGPDEHGAVRAGMEAFKRPSAPPIYLADLGDSRQAVLLRAVNHNRAMVGAIMLVLDTRAIKDPRALLKGMTAKLHRALVEFADMRPTPEDALLPATPGAASHRTVKTVSRTSRAPLTPGENRSPPSGAAAGDAKAAGTAPADSPSASPSPELAASARRVSRRGAAGGRGPPSAKAPGGHASRGAGGAPARIPGKGLTKIAGDEGAKASDATSTKMPGAHPRSAGTAPNRPRTPDPPPTLREPPTLHAVPFSGVPRHARFANLHPRDVPPEIDRLHAALRRAHLSLHVQRLVPLTKDSPLRRYEVLLRSAEEGPNAAPQALIQAAIDHGLGSMIDRRVITDLIAFLVRHPQVWKSSPVQFSVNLTSTALHDEHFIKFVGLCLAKSALPRSMIAFEVDATTAFKLAGKMAQVSASLHRLGCPLVLDDFSLRTECLALLRLPGVHYVKLAPEITAKMRSDKLAQAAITAVVQMARVLGMHTVAKHAETASEREWFTALGVDLVQSNTMAPPEALALMAPESPQA